MHTKYKYKQLHGCQNDDARDILMEMFAFSLNMSRIYVHI